MKNLIPFLLIFCPLLCLASGMSRNDFIRAVDNSYDPRVSGKLIDIKSAALYHRTYEYQGQTTGDRYELDVYVWVKEDLGYTSSNLYLNYRVGDGPAYAFNACSKLSQDSNNGYFIYRCGGLSLNTLGSGSHVFLTASFPDFQQVWHHSSDGGSAYRF